MIARNRPARVAAAVGATLAAGATAMLVATTTASADEPGRCVQNVNVREEPDAESRIVALCEEGTRVKLGEERDGFVRIDELGGWAAKDYVKADESSSSSSSSDDRDDDADERSSSSGSSDDSSDDSSDSSRSSEDDGSGSSGAERSDSANDGNPTTGQDVELGGLLG